MDDDAPGRCVKETADYSGRVVRDKMSGLGARTQALDSMKEIGAGYAAGRPSTDEVHAENRQRFLCQRAR
jgi:hypothetical protein